MGAGEGSVEALAAGVWSVVRLRLRSSSVTGLGGAKKSSSSGTVAVDVLGGCAVPCAWSRGTERDRGERGVSELELGRCSDDQGKETDGEVGHVGVEAFLVKAGTACESPEGVHRSSVYSWMREKERREGEER